MPAIIQPPSDKLTKLKLFLEKTKTEFIAQNSELADWMNDRKLQVDRFTFAQEELTQTREISSVETELIEKLAIVENKDAPLASSISREEYDSIMEKMVELLQLPAGQLEEESELYLEQQLSDILGFTVSANLDNHKLLYSTGIMESLSHLKRFPTDTLEQHSNFHEAGIQHNRSAFGWFTTTSELDQKSIEAEKYYISVPLYYHHDWSSNYTELKQWYKFRKVVVVNPVEQRAVVGVIGTVGPITYTRKQFGGSPELIHSGKIWSPKSAGHVLVLFVDDPKDEVPLGPVFFKQIFSKE